MKSLKAKRWNKKRAEEKEESFLILAEQSAERRRDLRKLDNFDATFAMQLSPRV